MMMNSTMTRRNMKRSGGAASSRLTAHRPGAGRGVASSLDGVPDQFGQEIENAESDSGLTRRGNHRIYPSQAV